MSALDLFERPEWYDRAACRTENDPGAWFPHSTEYETAAYAKAICATCPVRGVRLTFSCELGNHGFVIDITNHKGTTQARTTATRSEG